MRSSYTPQSIRNKSGHYTLNVASFGGVDYATQKFNVSEGRAIDLLNYVYKDGVVQKRNGVEEFFEIPKITYYPVSFSNPKKDSKTQGSSTNSNIVHNMWRFKAEDGNMHLIAHIGVLLCEIKNFNTSNMTIEPIRYNPTSDDDVYYCYEFVDEKVDGFVGGNKFWFLGGTKYMLLRFQDSETTFIPVEEATNIVPIPTTTISIAYDEARASNRQSLDNVNLLTQLRKNQLVSGVGKTEGVEVEEYYKYTLDSPMVCKEYNTYKNQTEEKVIKGIEDTFIMTIEHRG